MVVKVIKRPPIFTATKFDPKTNDRRIGEPLKIYFGHSYDNVYSVATNHSETGDEDDWLAAPGDWIIQDEDGKIVDVVKEEEFLKRYDSRIG